jgi:hypothetical protein
MVTNVSVEHSASITNENGVSYPQTMVTSYQAILCHNRHNPEDRYVAAGAKSSDRSDIALLGQRMTLGYSHP